MFLRPDSDICEIPQPSSQLPPSLPPPPPPGFFPRGSSRIAEQFADLEGVYVLFIYCCSRERRIRIPAIPPHPSVLMHFFHIVLVSGFNPPLSPSRRRKIGSISAASFSRQQARCFLPSLLPLPGPTSRQTKNREKKRNGAVEHPTPSPPPSFPHSYHRHSEPAFSFLLYPTAISDPEIRRPNPPKKPQSC